MSQDIRLAVRPILYDTGYNNVPYSFSGTMFVVAYLERCFGVTCRHVLGKDGIHHLIVFEAADPVKGMTPLLIRGLHRIDSPDLGELNDIAVIEFDPSVTVPRFRSEIYDLRLSSALRSDPAHRLRICGYLNEKGRIDYDGKVIQAGLCDITCTNLGPLSADPHINQAIATYRNLDFSSFDGISGSPVFNLNMGVLTGMVVRAGLKEDGTASIWYIEIYHIFKILEAVYRGSTNASYTI
jgi:hypothetical protein